jgi:DNA (cytosine-5)-methyltransferase 1
MKKLRVVDFFCGAGGFSEGFRQAGFEVVMGIDNWAPAIKTHNLNHDLNDTPQSVLEYEDINKIFALPNTEVIVGSPPCVSFSLSNKGGNADKSLGIRLIEAYLRVVAVKKHQPHSILEAWLMENVPNSKNYVKNVYTFDDLNLSEWAISVGKVPSDVALNVKDNGDVLKASDYGAAQARNRFVCGEVIGDDKFPFPKKVAKESTVESIRSLLPPPLNQNLPALTTDPNYSNLIINTDSITDHFYDTGVYEIEWQRAKVAKLNHPYMGRMSFPENEKKPSRTIMATRSASTREAILYKSEVNRKGDGEYRMPTVREAASLMGFPLTYVFYGTEATKWRQIGNAVCPQMAFALANGIRCAIGLPECKVPSFSGKVPNEGVAFLDNFEAKNFSNPPKRNPKALFRNHPIKAGNMTVALTNKSPITGESEWSVIAFMGTGKDYRLTKVSKNHNVHAKNLLSSLAPKFLDSIDSDMSLTHRTPAELSILNGEYHYNDEKGEHPLSLINKIAGYIDTHLSDAGDKPIDTSDTILGDIKKSIPLSQLMAIYAVGKLIHPENL